MAGIVLTVEANGLEVAYLQSGDSGPLVVLLHGFPDTAYGWQEVMDRVAAAGYRAVAPNLRGYAPTSLAPDGDYSVLAASRDVLALVRGLGHNRAALVGVDWGGVIAYGAANLDSTTIVKVASATPHLRLFSWDLRQLWLVRHVVLFQLRGVAERVVRRDDFAYIDRLHERWSPNWHPADDPAADVKRALRSPGGLEAALGYYRSLASFYVSPAAKHARGVVRARTSVPTLAFAGTADHAVAPNAFKGHEAAFTGPYRFAEVDGLGHFPRERPDALADLLLDFLGPAAHAPV
jgi:pimeloyl-ACP methyl ester carboxylesterase